MLFAGTTASAAIPQTVNQSGADVNGWASAIWGTPALVASGGNAYVTTNTFFVRTPNNSTPAAFGGQSLQIDTGGTLYLKHNGGAAAVNLLMNGGNITFHGGTASSPSPLSGTIQVLADSRVTTDQSGSNSRDIWLQSPITGSAMLTVAMVNATNSLWISGNNSAYSGNWTNTSGFLQIVSGTANALGSGGVILVNANNSLLINSTNTLVINNPISGLGSVTKQNTNTVTLGGTDPRQQQDVRRSEHSCAEHDLAARANDLGPILREKLDARGAAVLDDDAGDGDTALHAEALRPRASMQERL
jgi:hypothetical protein